MTNGFDNTIALITGGQRGLGAAFTDELLRRGVQRIYVTSRTPTPVTDSRVQTIALDVTNDDQVAQLAEQAPDVTLLINNAGVANPTPLLSTPWEQIIANFEANTYGPLRVARAMAPVLAKASSSHLVNIHSALSWIAGAGAYGASKAALWSLTNQLRMELSEQGTTVTGVHLGLADTDMSADVDAPKVSPLVVAEKVVDGVAAGDAEVLVDAFSENAKALLSGPVEKLVLAAP